MYRSQLIVSTVIFEMAPFDVRQIRLEPNENHSINFGASKFSTDCLFLKEHS